MCPNTFGERSDGFHQTFSVHRVGLFLLGAIALTLLGAEPLRAAPVAASNLDLSRKVDVVIFINTLGDSARVGIAYRRFEPKRDVEADLDRLLTTTHWQLASIQLDNTPVLPKQPPTTAVLISLQHAPQMLKSGPDVQPYLEAFQRFNTIEVDFLWPGAVAQSGQELRTKDYDAIFLAENGVYRYIVSIKKHVGPLADLSSLVGPSIQSQSSYQTASHQEPGKKGEGIVLVRGVVVGGGVLLILVTFYLLLKRR